MTRKPVYKQDSDQETPSGVQFIRENNLIKYAVVPYDLYQEMMQALEDTRDLEEAESLMASVEKGEEEVIPIEIIDALMNGENPIKVWREFRGISRKDFTDKIGISLPYLSQLETGKRQPSLNVLKKMSEILSIDTDHLLFDMDE